ncbi:AgmX/PglI C-terminal domain-containing protein [Archangium violaceum]|uniref:AgmX/PglI C-terminal domain-containing protein n=1 Tax=Archangium violaceum TaxID=83451 RepID=UPI00193B13A0|nr:AgmX/PglI C-terminal domain-containing protein [Archangium violaceum]QRK13078.1 AgmX/PglI C-terminal domain-containing protein [Archangium violaceum]
MSGRAVFLWVVIPFVALSALALWLTRDTPTHAVTVASGEAPPLPEPPKPKPPKRSPPLAPALAPPPEPTPREPPPSPPPPPENEPLEEPPPGTWSREEIRVALRAVQPLVRSCLEDASVRHPGPHSVKLRFTLDARGEHGRFQRGEVVESSVQDPFVTACLLDTLADTQFSAPPGNPPLTLTHPFHFRPR